MLRFGIIMFVGSGRWEQDSEGMWGICERICGGRGVGVWAGIRQGV